MTKKNATVREVLDIIFENTVAYKERNKHIILIKLAPSTSTEISKIHGYIIDALSGEKIPNTSIYEKKTRLSAISDKYGHYILTIKDKEQKLILFVNKANYKDTVIYIKQKGNKLYNITF